MLSVVVSAVTSVLTYSLVVLVGLWCWFQWRHRHLLRVARKLPLSRKKWPILGHAPDTLLGIEEATRLAIEMTKDAVAEGLSVACWWCGPLPLILVHGPDDIQKVLNSSATSEKAKEYDYAKHALGEGLLTASGQVWKMTRRNINPLFHPRNLEHMMPVFNRNCVELVSGLSEHVGKGPINVVPFTMSTALKSICNLIFGPELDFDAKSEGFQCLKHVVEKIPELAFRRVMLLWLRIDAVFNFLYRKELKQMDVWWKTFTEAPLKKTIDSNAQRRAKEIEEQGDHDSRYHQEHEGALNLVQVYHEMQKRFPQITDEDLKAEMVTFYASGTDTVGLSVSNCLLALGKHPDIQDRLYEEILLTLGPNDDVTTHDIDKMHYLDQVYKETLRWSLILPYIARRATEDIRLSSCTIPAGSTVVVVLMGLHLDPNIYPDPEKFDPERFTSENSEGRHRYAFLPLSGGPRACIGKRYAELFVKTAMIHLLRKYRVSADRDVHDMRRKLAMVMVSTEGYYVSLQHRC